MRWFRKETEDRLEELCTELLGRRSIDCLQQHSIFKYPREILIGSAWRGHVFTVMELKDVSSLCKPAVRLHVQPKRVAVAVMLARCMICT